MKFVHAADIHLDSPLQGLEAYEGAPVDQIRGATRTAFEALVELCLDEEADFLVVAGDLYDGDWQDFNTGLYFARQMVRLGQADIPVFVLHGNHDAQSRITRQLRLPDNVHVFLASQPETRTLDDLGVALHGQSFPTQHVTENLAAGYPPPVAGLFNIGVLHTALEGYREHATYAPCSLAELRSAGYDYWALGHVHQHEVLANEPHVVFPGNLQGRHILETGPKGCCVVDVEDGQVQSVTFRELDVVRWAQLDVAIEDSDSFEDVVQAVGEPLAAELAKIEPRTLAVRLSLVGETDLHPMLVQRTEELTYQLRALATEVGGGAIYIEKVQLATRAPARRAPPTESLTDALDLIAAEAEHLRTDADGRELILSLVHTLLERLPASLKMRSDHLSLKQPEHLEELLHGAQALALARLWPTDEDK